MCPQLPITARMRQEEDMEYIIVDRSTGSEDLPPPSLSEFFSSFELWHRKVLEKHLRHLSICSVPLMLHTCFHCYGTTLPGKLSFPLCTINRSVALTFVSWWRTLQSVCAQKIHGVYSYRPVTGAEAPTQTIYHKPDHQSRLYHVNRPIIVL